MRQSMKVAMVLLIQISILTSTVHSIGNHKASRILSSFSFRSPFFPDAGLAAVSGWEPRGSTVIQSDSIQLTTAETNLSGMILNKRPYFLKTVELTMEFNIHSDSPNGADGMVLWLADQPAKSGPTFGGPEIWNGVAVILDSFDNDGNGEHPNLSVHYNDGTMPFDFESDGKSTLLGTCTADYRNPEVSSSIHLYIENDEVNLFVDARGDGNWVRCLPATRVKMPQRYFFSISASTGGYTDIHELIRMEVNTMDEKLSVPDPEDLNKPSDEMLDKKNFIQDPVLDPSPSPIPSVMEMVIAPSATEKSNNVPMDGDDETTKKLIEDLEARLEVLTKEKNAQTASANEANRKLEIFENEKEQRDIEWQTKQNELQSAQHLAQTLLAEKNKASKVNPASAVSPDCPEVFTECTNLQEYYTRLDESLDSVQEIFGHELLEIQYLFNDQIRYVSGLVLPISHASAAIQTDATQASSQMTQFSSVIDQLTQYVSTKIGDDPDGDMSRKHADLADNLTTLQRSLIQIQVESNKLREKLNTLKEKMKRSESSNGPAMIISLILGVILGIQCFGYWKDRRGRNRRGAMLY